MSAEAFVRCARAQVGKPYQWARQGPDAFDCSGLVSFCFHQATGRTMTPSSHEQYRLGDSVNTGKGITAGDLLFYDTMGDGAGHVGIAIGGGKAVHAMNPQRGVIEARVDANYGGPFIGARRLAFGDGEKPGPGDGGKNITQNITGAVSLTTPFRAIPALSLATWEAEFAARQSPLSKAEIADCFAACGGLAVALDQAIGETSLKDADAIRDKNLLRLTEADGSTFKKYSAYWKPFAEYLRRIFDPGYKASGGKPGPYYPGAAGGVVPGYDLSIAGYKVIYQGGPGCLSSRGATCANGERYDPNKPMTGAGVVNDPNAPSINRSIAASMLRMERWFGSAPAPGPTGPTGPAGGIAIGRVPKPIGMQIRLIANNTAWDDLGPRQPRGIVLHRMLGTLNGTDAFFRGEARNRALTDFGVGRGSLGPVYQWNDLAGRRAPHASGPADGVKEDGRPFVDRYGVNAINRDCASVEIEGFQNDAIPAETWRSLVELVAWLADSWLRVDYRTWPRNRDGLHALLHHREFTAQKECPFAVVIGRTGELIEAVRARLQEYQA